MLLDGLGVISLGGISLAAVVGVAWLAFKAFAARWMEAKFAERLANYRHLQNQEIENLRFKISTLLDRTVRLHTIEFEVLTQAWQLLSEAYGPADSMMMRGRQNADISRLNTVELTAHLDRIPYMTAEDKAEIISEPQHQRQAAFDGVIEKHRHLEVYDRWVALNNYLATKLIFIEPDLRQQFVDIRSMIGVAIDDFARIYFRRERVPGDDRNIHAEWQAAPPAFEKLRDAVSARLWDKPEINQDAPAR